MTPEWQKQRSGFNHDWLKNRFLTGLSSFLNILNDKVEDPELETRFLNETLPQWPDRIQEALDIVDRFESEMSPKILFQYPPLSRCDSETTSWLPDLVHSRWCQRYRPDRLCEDSRKAIKLSINAYKRVREATGQIDHAPSTESLRQHIMVFSEFRSACMDVSNALSRFPSKIAIV